tara:strand:+ start:41 stop:511 length:471 start_codon:yes stop_codon:yes gene_type:complete
MTLITTPATAEQAVELMSSAHIQMREKIRLHDQMLGIMSYKPRWGGSGQALLCRGGGCGNLALEDARKQLCPTHYASFLERSNRAKAMPTCTGTQCNVHTRLVFEGQPMCSKCSDAEQTRRSAATSRLTFTQEKHAALESASTVEELKDWIKDYML